MSTSSDTDTDGIRIPAVPDLGQEDEYDLDLDDELRERGIVERPKRRFLVFLSATGHISHAAKLAGVSRQATWVWREKDPLFSKTFAWCERMGCERLEEEARRRAFEGVVKPVFQKGVMVGYVREYSDTLAMFLLRKIDPAYRDKVELNVHTDNSLAAALAAARKRAEDASSEP